MIKVIPSGSFDFGMPVASLVDVHSRGVDSAWMTKRAAVLHDAISSIRPEKGHSYIHLISMGAGEYLGMNRNGDYFNEKSAEYKFPFPKKDGPSSIKLAGGLTEYHKTFKKHGHVFLHHNNRDPINKIGDIVDEAYNPDMHRGELIIKVSNHHPEWKDELEKLANGKDIPFSMAIKVPFDYCTLCGHQAVKRADYCDHLKDQMTEIVKSGYQVGAINDQGTFFDISKVFKPADRIAWSIQKVASDFITTSGGAELAELMNVSASVHVLNQGPVKYVQKMAVARKLAEIEKTIDGAAQSKENKHLASGCAHKKMSEQCLSELGSTKLSSALNALNRSQISLSLHDFLKLAMGSKFDLIAKDVSEAEAMLPGMYTNLLKSGSIEECASDSVYDGDGSAPTRQVKQVIEKIASNYSLAYEPAYRRIRTSIVRDEMPTMCTVKKASMSKAAEVLVKEYAKYQLSMIAQNQSEPLVERLVVLGNWSA